MIIMCQRDSSKLLKCIFQIWIPFCEIKILLHFSCQVHKKQVKDILYFCLS